MIVLCLILLVFVFIITILVFKKIKCKDKILLCSLVVLNLTIVSKITTSSIAVGRYTYYINTNKSIKPYTWVDVFD